MLRYTARIESEFDVVVDETQFTPELFAEFSQYIFPMDTVEEAVAYLADLYARSVIDNSTEEVEGLGRLADLGVKFIGTNGARDFGLNAVHVEIEAA